MCRVEGRGRREEPSHEPCSAAEVRFLWSSRVDPDMRGVPATRLLLWEVREEVFCLMLYAHGHLQIALWDWSFRLHHKAEEIRRQSVKLSAQWGLENPMALGELMTCSLGNWMAQRWRPMDTPE